MKAATPNSTSSFSLTSARSIVRDLFVPDSRIYWLDFLTSIVLGHVCYWLARRVFTSALEPAALKLLLAGLAFAAQCACYFRAVNFVHEIVHLPEKKFRVFRIVWNLLCGIPFLVPSFTYYTHLDHHRRKLFGTHDDGEYLPLAKLSPFWILVYLSQGLWVPPLAVLRFGLITPLMWFCPPLRRWIHQHASSLVMDPTYIRPLPTKTAFRIIRLQEAACFLYLLAIPIFTLRVLGHWPIPYLIHGYLTAVALITMNCVRTLASHRWSSDGHEGTFIDQMLDSVTLDNDSLLAVLLNPVGLRYHATHHLFPSLPYHNMRTAHKRLMAQLPADSPYRLTVRHAIGPILSDLWRAAAQSHSRHSEGSSDGQMPSPWQIARSS
jgi:fatty acid desaturase